jgi:hypothetical protein
VVAILDLPSTPKKTYFVEISVENSNQVCYQKKELHLHIFQNGPILNFVLWWQPSWICKGSSK